MLALTPLCNQPPLGGLSELSVVVVSKHPSTSEPPITVYSDLMLTPTIGPALGATHLTTLRTSPRTPHDKENTSPAVRHGSGCGGQDPGQELSTQQGLDVTPFDYKGAYEEYMLSTWSSTRVRRSRSQPASPRSLSCMSNLLLQ